MNYSEGDLVEAVKGETVIRGRLRAEPSGRYFWVGDSGLTTESFTGAHFTVSVIEKAAPKIELPTESGSVVRISNEGNQWHWLFWRANSGVWDAIDFRGRGVFGLPDPIKWLREQDEVIESVEVLEPVHVTAKKVLEAIEERYGEDFFRNKNDGWDDVAKAFGVTT